MNSTASGSTGPPGSTTPCWPASTSSSAPIRRRASVTSTEDALTEQIAQATRRWDDEFALTLERRFDDAQARHLLERYRHALPDSYKDTHSGHEAAQDLAMLELLEEPGQLVLHLFRRPQETTTTCGSRCSGYGEPMMLSDVLPVLHSLGGPGRGRATVRGAPPAAMAPSTSTISGCHLPAGAEGHRRGYEAKVESAFSRRLAR